MTRHLFLLLTLLASVGFVAAAEVPPVEVMGLLGSRELLGQVLFLPGEAQLGPAGKAELDRISERLSAAGNNSKLIRIEGFSSRDDISNDAMDLAMARARAVEHYLREVRTVTADIYLMGQGSSNQTQAEAKVEVVLYDTLLPIGDAPVDHVIKKW